MRFSPRERVHAFHQRGEIVAHDEVLALLLERLHGRRRGLVGDAALVDLRPFSGREIGVLLGARKREFLLDDLLRQHEPGIIMAGRQDVLQRGRACRSPASSGAGSRLPVASNHSDDGPGSMRMPWSRPDRRPVLDALGVVPHPVAVDQPRAGRLGDADHQPVDMFGHAADHACRRPCPAAPGPVPAHQIVIAADAAGGDDHRPRAQLEFAGDIAAALLAARDVGRYRAPRRPHR